MQNETQEISQLFLRQMRNLTRFNTVYVPEDRDASRAIEDLLAN